VGKGATTESLLIITGTMGAGKTTVLGEMSDILALRHIPHAAIDLDALGLAYLPSAASNEDVMYGNLQSVCKNYASHGAKRFLVARAIEDRAELEVCRRIIPAANTIVCRLTANIETMQQRVKIRELGRSQKEYVARVAELDGILDRARLEDFTISSENRSPADIAREALARAGWISD